MSDESWIYSYDPETKEQSSQWKSPQSPRAKMAWQVRSSTKNMLIVFFDVKGIVHSEFVSPNSTVNSDFYCDVLRRSRECAIKKTGILVQPQLAPSS
jgi:histone-lysine N-methyltransferase SETMAR